MVYLLIVSSISLLVFNTLFLKHYMSYCLTQAHLCSPRFLSLHTCASCHPSALLGFGLIDRALLRWGSSRQPGKPAGRAGPTGRAEPSDPALSGSAWQGGWRTGSPPPQAGVQAAAVHLPREISFPAGHLCGAVGLGMRPCLRLAPGESGGRCCPRDSAAAEKRWDVNGSHLPTATFAGFRGALHHSHNTRSGQNALFRQPRSPISSD